MENQKKFIVFFIFIILMLSVTLVSSKVNTNRDRSLDDMIGKLPKMVNMSDNELFSYNKSLQPPKKTVRYIEREKDFVVGNDNVIIKSSKNNTISNTKIIADYRYLSVEDANIKDPVEVTMWVGTHEVLYGIKRLDDHTKSYNDVATNGEHLFNVESQYGYITFNVEHFSTVIAGLPDYVIKAESDAWEYSFDVDNYCSPTCHPDSTYIQFVSPSTNATVQVFNGESYNDSSISVRLIEDENIFLIDNVGTYDFEDLPMTVFVCENAFCSEDADTFLFSVLDTVPYQISSIADIRLDNLDFQSYLFSNAFKTASFKTITLQWEDDILMQTVSKTCFKGAGACGSAVEGQIYVEMYGFSDDVWVYFADENNYAGDTNVYVTARHPSNFDWEEQITQGYIRVVSDIDGENGTSGDIPVQIASISPMNLSYNDIETRQMSSYFLNYTANMSYLTILNLTSSTNLTIEAGETVEQTNLSVGLSSNGETITVTSNTNPLTNYRVYLNACNINGCVGNSTDSSILVNIETPDPSQISSIAPLELAYNSEGSRITSTYFINYANSSIDVPSPDGNSSTNLERGETITFTGAYTVEYSNLDVITVTSFSSNYTFDINITVQGSSGATETDNLRVVITETGTGETDTDGDLEDTGYSGFVNMFLNLFPDSDDLSIGQRAGFVALSLIIVTALLFAIAHSQTGGIPTAIVYITGMVNVAMFFFFVAIGYIPIVVPIMVVLIAGAIVFFRLRGGGGD